MKKIVYLFLAVIVVISMTACQSGEQNSSGESISTTGEDSSEATVNSTEHDETEQPADAAPTFGVYGDTLVLGNIKFTIPEGFLATVVDERSFQLGSKDNECYIGLFAADIGELDEDRTKIYLQAQKYLFIDEDTTKFSEESFDGHVAEFDVTLDYFGELSTNLQVTSNIYSTFTDSWYAYTVFLKCDASSDLLNEYITTYVNFVTHAEHIGAAPRFDFVQ